MMHLSPTDMETSNMSTDDYILSCLDVLFEWCTRCHYTLLSEWYTRGQYTLLSEWYTRGHYTLLSEWYTRGQYTLLSEWHTRGHYTLLSEWYTKGHYKFFFLVPAISLTMEDFCTKPSKIGADKRRSNPVIRCSFNLGDRTGLESMNHHHHHQYHYCYSPLQQRQAGGWTVTT